MHGVFELSLTPHLGLKQRDRRQKAAPLPFCSADRGEKEGTRKPRLGRCGEHSWGQSVHVSQRLPRIRDQAQGQCLKDI